MAEQSIESPCPVCGTIGVSMHVDVRELAYFGEHAQISLSCKDCGWRRTEFLPPEPSDPVGMRLLVNSLGHLAARLVRSATSSVILPELGLEVHPGSDAAGYITNVEGMLNRFIDQVDHVVNHADESSQLAEAKMMHERLIACVTNPKKAPLLIELLDPGGHAQIIHADVETWGLSSKDHPLDCGQSALGPSID